MTGAWDDPAVRAAVAATNRVRVNHGQEPVDPAPHHLLAPGWATIVHTLTISIQLGDLDRHLIELREAIDARLRER